MKALFALFRTARGIGPAIGIVVVGIFVTSGGLAQEKDAGAGKIKQSTYAALAETPEKARLRKNPFESDAGAIAVGEKLFEQHCAGCHGRNAGGREKGPSLLREEGRQTT